MDYLQRLQQKISTLCDFGLFWPNSFLRPQKRWQHSVQLGAGKLKHLPLHWVTRSCQSFACLSQVLSRADAWTTDCSYPAYSLPSLFLHPHVSTCLVLPTVVQAGLEKLDCRTANGHTTKWGFCICIWYHKIQNGARGVFRN